MAPPPLCPHKKHLRCRLRLLGGSRTSNGLIWGRGSSAVLTDAIRILRLSAVFTVLQFSFCVELRFNPCGLSESQQRSVRANGRPSCIVPHCLHLLVTWSSDETETW
ncbi:unnamed protein product [Pleuronectes platessa]|uniref:Uncharacterized protein n=1 Tax=Pleuronectes platessa TaxID=8262 RepID=A0A9N7YWB6_PLEPL|nr:unnamed protein product [Pleuronectes platessa]